MSKERRREEGESARGRRKSAPRDTRDAELYRAVIDALPDMVFRTRADGTIFDFVPGIRATPYVSPAEFLGKKVQDVLPPEVGQMCRDAVQEALRTQQIQTFEYELIESGTPKYYEDRIVPAGVNEVVSIVRDITARRTAERELERTRVMLSAVTESTAAVAFVHTEDGIAYANAAATEVTGYTPDELRQNGFLTTVHPDFKKLLTDRMRSRLRGNPEPSRYEFKIIHKNGEEKWIDCAVGGVVEFDGKPAVIGTALDITDRKRNEEALRLAREELERRIEERTMPVGAHGLTFRELSVLHLIAEGKQDREIADLLGISHRTVQTHVARILKKMGARSRTDASVRAHKEGIIK